MLTKVDEEPDCHSSRKDKSSLVKEQNFSLFSVFGWKNTAASLSHARSHFDLPWRPRELLTFWDHVEISPSKHPPPEAGAVTRLLLLLQPQVQTLCFSSLF